MYRVKDFIMMDVYNLFGKKIGEIRDIQINYFLSKVEGFKIASKGISKSNYLKIDDIVSITNCIIVKEIKKNNGFFFDSLKNKEVIDKDGILIGIVEDLLIDETTFLIKGLIISQGAFIKFLNGKEIILLNETILGDENVLFLGSDKINLKCLYKGNAKYV